MALVLAVFAERLFELFYGLLVAPSKRKKILRDNAYHTVIGTQVTKYASKDSSGDYNLQYKYEVNGKTYRCFICVDKDNCSKRPLYYVKNPRAATDKLNQLGNYENTRVLYWMIACVLFILISLIAPFGR
ncbi:MAG: hypothetical protein ACI4V3_01865 [Faecousia sp.]